MPICPVCGCRWADFPEEDYVLDVPSPPGEGIYPRPDRPGAHERRMKQYHKNDIKYCGCVHDDPEERSIIVSCTSHVMKQLCSGKTLQEIFPHV